MKERICIGMCFLLLSLPRQVRLRGMRLRNTFMTKARNANTVGETVIFKHCRTNRIG